MPRLAVVICSALMLLCAHLQGVTFKKEPAVTSKAGVHEISFTLSDYTDVTVAIVDASGTVVRHLVSGALGKNPPAPLQANTLSQTVTWDGNDDFGKKVSGDCQVLVKLGVYSKLKRYLGDDKQVLSMFVRAISVAPNGDLILLGSENKWGRSWVRRFDNQGKYKNTIVPYPANTPKERLKDIHYFEINGERIPYVANAQNGSTQSFMSALREQDISYDKDGNLIISSAVGSLSNHGPAHYLLKIHPEGGHPVKDGYMGPQIINERGFFGGAGESVSNVFSSTACSPDYKWIYLKTHIAGWSYDKLRTHGIYRVTWSDKKLPEKLFIGKKEPGNDDYSFNMPIGIGVDTKGNIYVCDHGNARVMIYNSEGKFLNKFTVKDPYQVKIHRKTGEIYVLSRDIKQNPTKKPLSSVRKFSALSTGDIKELASVVTQEKRNTPSFKAMALDDTGADTKIWVVHHHRYMSADSVYALYDKGTALERGEDINNRNGLLFPLYVTADEKNNRVIVKNFQEKASFKQIDLKTNEVTDFKLQLDEVAVSPSGHLLGPSGWNVRMTLFEADGKKKGFPGKPKGIGPWKLGADAKGKDVIAKVKGAGQGGRGFTYDGHGNFYVIKMGQYQKAQIDKYSADGELLKEKLIDNLPYGSGGIAVDFQGNIYVGTSLRPMSDDEEFWPHGFDKHVPKYGWKYYKKERPAPWDRVYYNTYMFYWGSVVKFGPEGGKFTSWRPEGYTGKQGAYLAAKPTDIPKDAQLFRTGYLNVVHAITGAKWIYKGCSPIPTDGESWGDPSCSCWNIRMCTDPYGRVFTPNAFRFSVEMIDTNGNQMERIGRYDNRDSAERDPEKVGLGWPFSVSRIGETLYICDMVNNRIAEVDLLYQAEATASIKQ